jgi:hypothetical protein
MVSSRSLAPITTKAAKLQWRSMMRWFGKRLIERNDKKNCGTVSETIWAADSSDTSLRRKRRPALRLRLRLVWDRPRPPQRNPPLEMIPELPGGNP